MAAAGAAAAETQPTRPTRPTRATRTTPPSPALYCVRAGLRDGQDVLELGCGWGSFSLFAARAFPGSRVTAVSNSRTQREYILKRARDYGVSNLQVITADMVEFQVGGGLGRGLAFFAAAWFKPSVPEA